MKIIRNTTVLIGVLGLGLIAGPTAQAQDAAIGFGAGLVKPEDVDSTVWLTGNIQLPLSGQLYLEPEVGFWKKGELKDLSAGANLVYKIPSSGVGYFVGGGAGIDNFRALGGSDSELSLHLLAGAEGEISSDTVLFGAIRYDIIDELNLFKVYGGVRFGL